MEPIDFILIGVIALIIVLAAFYVIRAKKKGVKCIGCPSGCGCSENGDKMQKSGGCGGNCGCCSGCASIEKND